MTALLLLTGSRTWTDRSRVRVELARWVGKADLMHGDCQRGLDAIADEVALELGWVAGETLHRRPADWDRYGRSAGPRRNEHMVEEAVWWLQSGRVTTLRGLAFGALSTADRAVTGTGDCVARMRRVGIRVRWVESAEAEGVIL